MKFAHIADCHLGGWKQPELKALNFASFQIAIAKCIKEKVEFVLIAGDLFDSAYPPIDILKDAFSEFRRLKENNIPVYIIAGSHDYSVAGKTFLDVLEKAGFCKNVFSGEERNGFFYLNPTIHQNIAIYGYPGKKSGLEVDEVAKVRINDAPGFFKILMLHTSIRDAVPDVKIKAVDENQLPRVDYLALGHLHINYVKNNRVYPGPIFPNSISELVDLGKGSFCIYDNGKIKTEEIKIKEVYYHEFNVKNALTATEEFMVKLKDENIKDKIVMIRFRGVIEVGKISDVDFQKIDSFLKSKGALVTLRSTSKLFNQESDIKLDNLDNNNLEESLIKKFEEQNPTPYTRLVPDLIKALQIEKMEDERSVNFEDRIMSESKKILEI